ncbi:uncharacterized protein LOC116619350 [Nematostella vectensis]|uniref:uncharacterized protein LOC116619350 n=1 Tax=Nematostella vectensis TaxID=45351 RepID=UPI0020773F72|nr:uncharacterized protein LOC116619350 [Nematostella vectensis]
MITSAHLESNSSVHPTTDKPLDIDIPQASSIILTTLSSLLFLLACVLLCGYHCKRTGRGVIETKLGTVIFFLGALLTTITTLGCYQAEDIYGTYRLVLACCIGIGVLMIGNIIMFESPTPDRIIDDYGRPLIPVGHTHGSMGIVVWVVTLPLCVLEMFFAIGAATKSPKPVYAAIEFVCLTQKIIQAAVYHFSLRHKVPMPLARMGCSWYLKTISLFNFAFWVDSIITTNSDNEFVEKLFGSGFSIVKAAYNALIIDYRLLCCLLFLEHALEMEDVRDTRGDTPYEPLDDSTSHNRQHQQLRQPVNVQVVHYSGYGYIIGIGCIALQLVNGLQYLNFVGDWSNVLPIVSDVIVIFFGMILVSGSNGSELMTGKWRETESKAIDVMVGFMGAVGFVFWFMKSLFCLLWSYRYSSRRHAEDIKMQYYLAWTTAKDFFRAVGMLFQMHFFVKMGPHFCAEPRNQHRRSCHLLVPAIMLALLSIFLSSVIDQYNGKVEHLIQDAHLDPAVMAFFEAAAPIHLGFCLHMFLHFFIIKRKMSELEYVHPGHSFRIDHVTSSVAGDDNKDENENNERQPLVPGDAPLPTIHTVH